MRNNLRATPTILAAILLASPSLAGDLDPPAGAIAPTMKTLDQVEPRTPIGPETTPGDASTTYRITESGTYYLTENLIGEINKTGIRINADDVTIDLMGFNVHGAGVGPDTTGISSREPDQMSGDYSRIRIFNGTIRGWVSHGIELTGGEAIIEGLIISDCDDGINVGENSIIRECIVTECRGFGIYPGLHSLIERCAALSCGEIGIFSLDRVTVVACFSQFNARNGMNIRGIVKESISGNNGDNGLQLTAGTATHCQAPSNGLDGIRVRIGSLSAVYGCVASSNLLRGIASTGGLGVSFEGNICTENSEGGISGNTRSLIRDNVVFNNTGSAGVSGITTTSFCQIVGNLSSSNGPDAGISAWDACRITDNHVVANAERGILALDDNTIERNSVSLSGTSGISVGDRCRIVDNNADSNASRGIYTSGRECSISNNRVANNTLRGIDCNGERNLVFGNFARDNGGINYEGPSNNIFGPIIIPPISGAITSFSDPDVMGAGTTDPYANFTY